MKEKIEKKQRPQKKEKLVFPYKEICVGERVVGRLYLVGTGWWSKKDEQATVILSFSNEERHREIFTAYIWNKGFFFTNGDKIDGPLKRNMLMVATLKQVIPIGEDMMGLIADTAQRMGKVLEENMPYFETLP